MIIDAFQLPATSRLSLQHPHTIIFFIAVYVTLAVELVGLLFFDLGQRQARRLYWSGTFTAASFSFLGLLPDWKTGIGMIFFFIMIGTLWAYWLTPYIKIRGKIYSFHVQDPDPLPDGTPPPPVSDDPDYDPTPDAYLSVLGVTTAKKMWWQLLAGSMFFPVGAIILRNDEPFLSVVCGALFLFGSAGVGYLDATWDYPVARGQWMQFGIIAVVTAGAFTVLYLLGYSAGRRWPVRHQAHGEQLIHPRFRDDDS